MNTSDVDPEEPKSYALRLQERAVRDITLAYVRIGELVSVTVANQWRNELLGVIAGLATTPRRCPVVPENFKREVRHLIYQRSGSKTTYRVLFTISGEDELSPDPPTVTILHVRNSATRPITRAQIREIESSQ